MDRNQSTAESALTQVMDLLRGLSPEERRRVLGAAEAFYKNAPAAPKNPTTVAHSSTEAAPETARKPSKKATAVSKTEPFRIPISTSQATDLGEKDLWPKAIESFQILVDFLPVAKRQPGAVVPSNERTMIRKRSNAKRTELTKAVKAFASNSCVETALALVNAFQAFMIAWHDVEQNSSYVPLPTLPWSNFSELNLLLRGLISLLNENKERWRIDEQGFFHEDGTYSAAVGHPPKVTGFEGK